jgi:hypothetical protein
LFLCKWPSIFFRTSNHTNLEPNRYRWVRACSHLHPKHAPPSSWCHCQTFQPQDVGSSERPC